MQALNNTPVETTSVSPKNRIENVEGETMNGTDIETKIGVVISRVLKLRTIGIVLAGAVVGVALSLGALNSGAGATADLGNVWDLTDDFSLVYGMPDGPNPAVSDPQHVIDSSEENKNVLSSLVETEPLPADPQHTIDSTEENLDILAIVSHETNPNLAYRADKRNSDTSIAESPFYQDFVREVPLDASNSYQRTNTPEDAWLAESPFYQGSIR